MGEKYIPPKSGKPSQFDIGIDPANRTNFPDQRPISVVLPDQAVGKYDIYQKDIPAGLRGKTFNGKTIRWMNNYGLKPTGTSGWAQDPPFYTLLLDKVDGATYVYHDPGSDQIILLKTSPYPGDPNKVQATLNLGDPSLGMG